MKIRYNRLWGIAFLVMGGVNLILAVWLLLLRSSSPAIITGVIVTLIGVLYLTRPYGQLDRNQVEVLPMIGSFKRSFYFKSDADVRFEGNNLLVNDGDRWRRVPLVKWLADPQDWKAIEARFGK